jgi:hypothetical protein
MRRWICTSCRTVLPDEERGTGTNKFRLRCGPEEHAELIDLDDPLGHDRLHRDTWPRPFGGGMYKLKRGEIRKAFRRWFRDLRRLFRDPRGAGAHAIEVPVQDPRAVTGMITATPDATTPPFGGAPCGGYGIMVAHTRTRRSRPRVLARDAWTTGLAIALDDGRSVRVPRGRLVLAYTISHPAPGVTSLDAGAIERYLTWLGIPAPRGRRPVMPAELARVVRLEVGGRVQLRADLVGDDGGDYRSAAGVRTRGVPVIIPSEGT